MLARQGWETIRPKPRAPSVRRNPPEEHAYIILKVRKGQVERELNFRPVDASPAICQRDYDGAVPVRLSWREPYRSLTTEYFLGAPIP